MTPTPAPALPPLPVVAYGYENTRPTERAPLMMVKLDNKDDQYPELAVPLVRLSDALAALAAQPQPSVDLAACDRGGVTQWQSALPSAVLLLNAAWNEKAGEEAIAGALDLCRRLAMLAPTAMEPAAPARDALRLKACLFDGHDPFVFYVEGMMTARVLSVVDEELTANKDDIFKDGQGDYEFTATHFYGQYGFEGRCELAPCWEFEQIGFTPLAVPLCDRCNGAGEIVGLSHGAGPDDYEFAADCPKCNGTGATALSSDAPASQMNQSAGGISQAGDGEVKHG